MKLRLILFFLFATSLFATPGSRYDFLNTWYPEHSCAGGNAIYLAMIYTNMTDMCHPCAMIGYSYRKGAGIKEIGRDCIVIYKMGGRIYAIDNRTMHPVEVPYSTVTAAIEFYWQTALGEDFIEIRQIGYRANDYWYN